MGTELCTGASALELAAAALSFLFAVILLDAMWVRLPEEFANGNSAPALRRQQLLNLFVALGATSAGAMLILWSSACGV